MSAERLEAPARLDAVSSTPLAPAVNLERSYADRRAGVIVTAANESGPPLYTFHSEGSPTEALERACALLDVMGAGWYIVSLSNPSTIYRDLQGTRVIEVDRPRVSANHMEAPRFADDPRTAEVRMLAKIGRLDLLRPLPHYRSVKQ